MKVMICSEKTLEILIPELTLCSSIPKLDTCVDFNNSEYRKIN